MLPSVMPAAVSGAAGSVAAPLSGSSLSTAAAARPAVRLLLSRCTAGEAAAAGVQYGEAAAVPPQLLPAAAWRLASPGVPAGVLCMLLEGVAGTRCPLRPASLPELSI
jgi:hypothetical protein